jgi:hypothetical protein
MLPPSAVSYIVYSPVAFRLNCSSLELDDSAAILLHISKEGLFFPSTFIALMMEAVQTSETLVN